MIIKSWPWTLHRLPFPLYCVTLRIIIRWIPKFRPSQLVITSTTSKSKSFSTQSWKRVSIVAWPWSFVHGRGRAVSWLFKLFHNVINVALTALTWATGSNIWDFLFCESLNNSLCFRDMFAFIWSLFLSSDGGPSLFLNFIVRCSTMFFTFFS